MLRGKEEREMALLTESSSVKESSEALSLVSRKAPRFHGG